MLGGVDLESEPDCAVVAVWNEALIVGQRLIPHRFVQNGACADQIAQLALRSRSATSDHVVDGLPSVCHAAPVHVAELLGEAR
jgi:hypothetical protein